jgi:hypothetical protein
MDLGRCSKISNFAPLGLAFFCFFFAASQQKPIVKHALTHRLPDSNHYCLLLLHVDCISIVQCDKADLSAFSFIASDTTIYGKLSALVRQLPFTLVVESPSCKRHREYTTDILYRIFITFIIEAWGVLIFHTYHS